MPSTEIQGVEVISITPMIPAKEISLSTACFTVKITKIELREVRVLASGETEKIVLLHYTVTNHTQSHIRRVIAVDFFLREGSQALTQSREHIQFGMEEPEENWDLIRAGETAQLVYALTQIEPAVTFESVELSVMVYDNTKHYESEGNAREDHVLLSLQ